MQNRLFLIVVAVLGLALGWYMGNRNRADDAAPTEQNASSAAEQKQLAALQDQLSNAQVFPADFRQINAFELLDVNGDPIDQSVLDGQWSVMFFGYTYCPDVCPLTLQVMKDVVAGIKATGEQPPQVIFVTVDPNRDTAERMKEYIGYFNPDFVGITGDKVAIHEFTRSLGIVAAFTANNEDPEHYIVDHTASMLVVDPERRVRGKLSAPHEAESVTRDFLAIRNAMQDS